MTIVKSPATLSSVPHHLVGAAEVAKVLGVTRQRVAQLAVTDDFPQPEVILSAGRIWSRQAIEAWAAGHPDRGRARARTGDHGWPIDRLTKLATEEAGALGAGHVGVEHLVLAMLRPEAPGSARRALQALGVEAEAVRERVVGQTPPASAGAPMRFTPRLQVTIERAQLHAERLEDPVVTSDHLLLALAGEAEDEDGAAVHWTLPDVGPEMLRQVVTMLTDAALVEEAPDPDDLRRRAKSRASRHPRGVRRLTDYRRRSDGVDPTACRPWGSVLWVGEWYEPGMPAQYTIDADGVPVLGPTGRPVGLAVDAEGFLALGDDGFATEVEFDVPEAAHLEWIDGFEPPPDAHPSVLAAFRRRPR